MAERSTIEQKVLEIAERVATSEGLEVVEAEVRGSGKHRIVRIFIDKPPSGNGGAAIGAGVTHADCELVSQQVGTILDVEDVVPGGAYHLEVSSPGVERKLARPRDFERFVGHKVKMVLRQPVENQRHWTGELLQFAEGVITLEPSPGKSIQIPLDQVEKANLKFEW